MEKQLIPQLRFSEFEGVWKNDKLGNVFTLFNGYAFSSSDSLKSDGALWVKIADVGIDKMKTDNLSYLPYEYVEKYKKFVLSEGDYVVALTRPILSSNLKIARIDEYFNNSLLNQRVAKLITENNSTFIYNLLKGNRLIKSIENNIAGSDPPNLSPNDINHINLKIPSLPEQQKIASFLSSVDDKITKLTKKKDLLEQYKKGIMQKIFSQELRFKDDNAKEFPKWEKKKIKDIAKVVGGGTPSTTNDEFWDGEINWFTPTEIKFNSVSNSHRKITSLGLKKSSATLLPKGTILLTTRATIGEVAIANEECTTNQGFQSLVVNSQNSEFFVFYLIQMNKNELYKRANGSTFKEISKKEIEKIKVVIPCLKEQTKTANFLSDIDIKIEALNTKIENSKAFKKGLLQKMFV